MAITVPPEGPIPARIMLVGEAPGVEEEIKRRPFIGASGYELDRMLTEARLSRSECFITNVSKERPPANDIGHFISDLKGQPSAVHTRVLGKWVTRPVAEGVQLLRKEIDSVRPNVIVALGGTAMWALTGKSGINKWRGSMLYTSEEMSPHFVVNQGIKEFGGMTPDQIGVVHQPIKVIPTIHPAAILREWNRRATVVHDLKRASLFRDGRPYPKPNWKFIIRPSFDDAASCLDRLLQHAQSGPAFRISFDLETRHGHIACAGLSWNLLEAICIPFMCVERRSGYWNEWEEVELIYRLYKILTHPNVQVVGQNILYDSQYTWRHWHFVPNVTQDCMIAQHSIFSDLPKALAYQASMYCNYYVYWKDEGKEWDAKMGEESLWYYNCEDCVYTDECGQTELEIVKKFGLEKVYETQQRLFWPVLKAMQRGVRIDIKRREELTLEVEVELKRREDFLLAVLGHTLNPNSPLQMKKLFYEDFAQPVVMTRAAKGKPSHPTCDDDALQKIGLREPLLKPILNCIADMRTLRVFLSTFLLAALDIDGRMRTAYNIGGSASGKSAPKTYRLSSSENAFGSGANLQNIPSEKSKSLGKAAARGPTAGLGDPYQLPNIRSIFIPDPGCVFFDADLDRADLQVVVWEADDPMLKAALRMGADIHLLNCYALLNKDPPPLDELVETHPKYRDHRGPLKLLREFSKVFCHATNYVGSARTVASHTGRTVHEVDRAQKLWFGAHPGIKRWHDQTLAQITRFRFVENRFGYRWYIFDRIDSVLPEAVAWVPQSTVSNVINKIWQNLHDNEPEIEVLMQVHDSLDGQFPEILGVEEGTRRIKAQANIVIPYEDPLIIPFGVKTSLVSWGDCQ